MLVENGFWNSAVNRLYYSLYYAVNALLVLHSIQTKSHSGTKSKFSEHFVKTGKFDKNTADFYPSFTTGGREAIMKTFSNTTAKVMPLFEPVREMIKLIEDEINKTQ